MEIRKTHVKEDNLGPYKLNNNMLVSIHPSYFGVLQYPPLWNIHPRMKLRTLKSQQKFYGNIEKFITFITSLNNCSTQCTEEIKNHNSVTL